MLGWITEVPTIAITGELLAHGAGSIAPHPEKFGDGAGDFFLVVQALSYGIVPNNVTDVLAMLGQELFDRYFVFVPLEEGQEVDQDAIWERVARHRAQHAAEEAAFARDLPRVQELMARWFPPKA